jgi:hypothetical protein
LSCWNLQRNRCCTGWPTSHASHIKMFIDGCNPIQFKCINRHTISPRLYKRPWRSRHVLTCLRQSFFQRSKCKDVFLIRRTSPDISLRKHFPILPFQTSPQYLVWWTICAHRCTKHEENSECVCRWEGADSPTLYVTLSFVVSCQCNLRFGKQNTCQEWVAWLSVHPAFPWQYVRYVSCRCLEITPLGGSWVQQ